jgi:hypothetical protein
MHTNAKATTSNWPTLFGKQLLTNDNMASLRMMKTILFVLYWSLSYHNVSSVRTSLSHWSLLLLLVVFVPTRISRIASLVVVVVVVHVATWPFIPFGDMPHLL